MHARLLAYPSSIVLCCLLLLMLLRAAPAAAVVGVAPATTPDALAELPSLWERRVGVSQAEPDFCTTEQKRETNPSAANAGSLEAGPPKFLVEGLEPGRSYWHCIFILNRQAEERTFTLTTLDVGGSLDPNVTLETRDTPAVVGAWIELSTNRVTLAPGERVIVPYRVDIPEQPPVGTSIGGIRITDVTPLPGGAGAAVRRSVVLQLQITFPGGAARELEIDDIEARRLIWRGRDSPRYRVKFVVSNRGNVVDTFRPTLRVDGLFGRRVASITGTPDVIVPGSAQRASLEWSDPPWVGRYTPKLLVKSDAGTRTIELPTLWVVPPWPYLVALGISLLLALVIVVRRRSAAADWRQYLDEEEEYGYDDEH